MNKNSDIKNYCSNCGNELKKDSKYCHECGHKVIRDSMDSEIPIHIPKESLPISFGAYLIASVMHRVAEKDWRGNPYVRIGMIIMLSIWLYETGAILGKLWPDNIQVIVETYEVEGKRETFTEFWKNEARKRLKSYDSDPHNFQTFIFKTDLKMFWGATLKDLPKVGEKKLRGNDAQESLHLTSLSMIEGIMFGSIYPEITQKMLVNTYEDRDLNAWKEAQKYGIVWSDYPLHESVQSKEKEVIGLAREYFSQYHPSLTKVLGLG